MDVKPLSKVVEKWLRNASGAGPDFKDGVLTTRKDQAALAIEAAPSYEAGVTAAIARGAFQKGLAESGHGKWKDKASVKGARNYPGGIRDAEGDYAKGVARVLSTLEGVTLPPRGPRGSPGNIERVRVGNEALHKMRIGG